MSGVEESQIWRPNGAVFPPNKPMEPRMEFSKSPVIYDYLMFIDFNEKGNCILGASDIDGTFWEGTFLYFENGEAMQKFDHSGHYIHGTTSDGKFINSKTVALAEDTGHITILSLDEDNLVKPVNYFKSIGRIPQISVWNDSSRIVSCAGRSISLWEADNASRAPIDVFTNYHTEPVTCVDTLKTDTNCFMSGSKDRSVFQWDFRNPEPASVLYSNEFATITSVSCNQYNDNFVAAATQGGSIYLVDRRVPLETLSVQHCFNATVNRIAFKDAKELAVCGDTSEVLIVDLSSDIMHIVYKDGTHKGHVKGMAWYKGDLYTCGFGKSVVKHSRN